MKEEPLLNCAKLAEILGRGEAYVTAMKRAGYRMLYPGRTTRTHALKWLAANPDFVARRWMSKDITKRLKKERRAYLERQAL